MTLSGIVLIVAPHAIVGLYLNLDDPANAATVSLAASLLGIAAVFQIVDGAQTVGSGAARPKDTRIPMLAPPSATGASVFRPATGSRSTWASAPAAWWASRPASPAWPC